MPKRRVARLKPGSAPGLGKAKFRQKSKMRKMITAKQKSARRKNIAVARAAKKRGAKKAGSTLGYSSKGEVKLTAKNIKGQEARAKKLIGRGHGTRGAAGLLIKGMQSGVIKSVSVSHRGKYFYFKTKKGGVFDPGNLEVMAPALRRAIKKAG